jgi:hypothetical protein
MSSTAWGFTDLNYSNGSAYADLDNDGDLDMIVNALNSEALIYKNRAAEQNKGAWLQIRLQGAAPNTFAVGARVHVKAGNNEYVDELTPTRGFFYLGRTPAPLRTRGTASSGRSGEGGTSRRETRPAAGNVPANQRLVVKIGDARPGKNQYAGNGGSHFPHRYGAAFTHREDDIQDFTRERLLPWKMSCPAPKILPVGDVNGRWTGRGAVSSGNARRRLPEASCLFSGAELFKWQQAAHWMPTRHLKTPERVFFDADGDKDLDLAVASGGNTDPANAASYAPRIYINDGKGNFTKKNNGMPVSFGSMSVVTAFDYDG